MSFFRTVKLCPLRIPSGWCVAFNSFGEEDPIIEDGVFINSEIFSQDLLLIETIRRESSQFPHIQIDLGWYPSERAEGAYRLSLMSENSDQPLKIFESRDRQAICQTIEKWLEVVILSLDNIDLDLL